MSVLRRAASCSHRLVRALAHAALAAALLLPAVVPAPAVAQPTGTAVEYYHAGFNHYFVTAYASEIALLDGGAYGGAWSRTGRTFPVWLGPGAGVAETCRFFSAAFAPRSSHFYTPFAAECALRKQDPAWTYEGIAFHLQPSPLGTCGAGTVPLYRLNNNGMSGAPNHRYTTDRATFDQMRAAGWLAEGNGPQIVFACVPSATGGSAPTGFWEGTTSSGEELIGAIYADGAFYFFYASDAGLGVVDGQAVFSGSGFASSQARDFVLLPRPGASAATVTGTIVAPQTLQGTIASERGTRSFTARYEGATGGAVSSALVAGAYDGIAATPAAYVEIVLSVSPGGALSGSASGCTVGGGIAARGATGLFDATVTLGATGCPLGAGTLAGVALQDPGSGALLVVAASADASLAFVFVGLR